MPRELDCRTDYLANHPAYIKEVAKLKYDQWLYTAPDRPYRVWVSEIEETARVGELPLTLLALDDAGLLGFVTLAQFDDRAGIQNECG